MRDIFPLVPHCTGCVCCAFLCTATGICVIHGVAVPGALFRCNLANKVFPSLVSASFLFCSSWTFHHCTIDRSGRWYHFSQFRHCLSYWVPNVVCSRAGKTGIKAKLFHGLLPLFLPQLLACSRWARMGFHYIDCPTHYSKSCNV